MQTVIRPRVKWMDYWAIPGLVATDLNFGPSTCSNEFILEVVARYFGVDYYAAYERKNRKYKFVQVRMYATYFLRKRNVTLKEIGQLLGGYDHTCVIRHLNALDDDLSSDKLIVSLDAQMHINKIKNTIDNHFN